MTLEGGALLRRGSAFPLIAFVLAVSACSQDATTAANRSGNDAQQLEMANGCPLPPGWRLVRNIAPSPVPSLENPEVSVVQLANGRWRWREGRGFSNPRDEILDYDELLRRVRISSRLRPEPAIFYMFAGAATCPETTALRLEIGATAGCSASKIYCFDGRPQDTP